MTRLLLAELRRAVSRRLVRLTALLAVAAVVIGGVIAFVNTSSLSDEAYQRRVADAAALQAAAQKGVASCLAARGIAVGSDVPNDVAQACFAAVPPRADDPRFTRRTLRGVLQGVSGVLLLVGWILGASLIGAEFPSRSMTTTLTWEPRRVRVFGAKTVAAAVTVSVLAAGVFVAMVAAMAPAMAAHGAARRLGDPSVTSLFGVAGRGIGLCALMSCIGLAVASVGRNTAAALGAGFAYIIIFENIVGSALPSWRPWLLLGNVIVVISGHENSEVAGRSVATAALFLVTATAALLAGAAAVFRARDLA